MARPIAQQIAYVRHAANERPEGDPVRAGLEDAQLTLEFVRDNEHVFKAAYRLLKHPAVIAFFATFPGAEFTELPHAVEKDLRGTTGRGTESSASRSRMGRPSLHDQDQ